MSRRGARRLRPAVATLLLGTLGMAFSGPAPAPQMPAAVASAQNEGNRMNGDDVFSQLDQAQAAVDHGAGAMGAQPWSPDLVMFLSTSILSIVALALVLGTFLLWKRSGGGQDVLRLYGVIIIVGLSTLLLVVGFSNDQLTPIVGLFGAIAGYLLGKDSGSQGSAGGAQRGPDAKT